MPIYEYHCPANGQTVEVWHSMLKTLTDWGQLCEEAALPPDQTPVHRRIGAGMFMQKPGSSHSMGNGSCCGDPGC